MIVPYIAASETYSSNMGLTGVAPERGWITDLAPGIRIDGAGARLDAFLDYRRDNLFYQGNSQWNRKQNLLNSYATLEAIDRWFYVDASANIVQRNLSVFGPISASGTNATSNLVETTTTQVAPYVKGRFGNVADYLLRFNAVDSRSDDPTLANTRVDQLVGSLKNSATAGALGWFSDVSATNVRNNVIGDRDDTRFRAGVVGSVGPHIHLTASSGRETTNYASTSRESSATPGAGIEWSPSKRTQFAGLREKRFFGYGHNVLLTHHTAMTAWRYTNTKDVAILPTLLAGYNPGAVNELMSDLLEASIPNPEDRKRAVRARMETLGATADLPGGGGVQTSRFYLDHIQEGSAAFLGIRNTLVLVVRQRDQQLLPFSPTAVDNFTTAAEIRERSTSLAWLYRLTPVTTFNLSAGRLKSKGMDVADLSSTQNTETAALNFRLAPKATASIGARRTYTNSTVTGSIRENAVVGSLTQRF
jgi:uncharacterized protein (PEP-CTERM system associated)